MASEISNPLEALTLAQLRERTSLKWRAFEPDVLPLWVAEMDVPLAEPVARALTDLVSRGDTGYPTGLAYAEALAAFAAERWGWDGIAIERTAIVPDVMMGIVEVLRLITSPGDRVIVNNPVYPPFYAFVEHMDRRVLEAPVGPDGRLDLAVLGGAMEEATAGGAGAAYLLCNPHNPLGTVHTADELEAVAALAERHGVRVVADEIHGPLVLPGARFVPYLSVPGAERGFSVMSASKGWNLAGLKAALAVAGPQAARDLARMPEEVSHGPSHVGVVAHTAALREGGSWLDALLAGLDANRQLLAKLLAKQLPDIGFRPPEATFLAWLDCSALGITEEKGDGRGNVMTRSGPAAFFTEQARVALNAGSPFGTGGVGHCRLNFGTSSAILTEAIERMSRAVAERDGS